MKVEYKVIYSTNIYNPENGGKWYIVVRTIETPSWFEKWILRKKTKYLNDEFEGKGYRWLDVSNKYEGVALYASPSMVLVIQEYFKGRIKV